MKLLIVRFSSIGDIVLTTPVLRAIKNQLEDVEVHYLTKKSMVGVIQNNENIDKTWTIEKSIDEIITELKAENFDWIIDLHNNLRTKALKSKLRKPYKAFPKLNWQKWLFVKFKINRMPDVHVVERYFSAVKHLGVKNENNFCEFPIDKGQEILLENLGVEPQQFVAIALGAKFKTKQLPEEKLAEVIEQVDFPCVLLGGGDALQLGRKIQAKFPRKVINLVGDYSLQQSASIVKQSAVLLTNDTGLMHIASAYDVPIVSVWGNTSPDFGMYPYRPMKKESFSIHQVAVSCRPCSKIGYESCPKKHFKCMTKQDSEAISKDINGFAVKSTNNV